MAKRIAWLISALVFCFFLIGSASAFNVDAPGSIIVFDSPRDIWITVANDSPIEQNLDIKFFSPAVSNLPYVPARIGPYSEAKFAITIFPSNELFGKTYDSTLIVSLGSDKIIRTIGLSFKKTIVPVPAPGPPGNGNPISAGLFSLAAFGSENALNIALAFIAAILLIAFIARFVRRLN
ncbi:MAG: hypothetical protein PHD95_04320 [Candidatus ainarchaeum sp.]|nr:hypothetical protein [Candidatus ainarchaeum sp.]